MVKVKECESQKKEFEWFSGFSHSFSASFEFVLLYNNNTNRKNALQRLKPDSASPFTRRSILICLYQLI